MGIREKEVLYRMIFMRLFKNGPMATRGSSKTDTNLAMLMNLDKIAIARTNYILAAIDEKYDREVFPE